MTWVRKETENEQREPFEQTPSVAGTTGRASKRSAGIDERKAAPTAFGLHESGSITISDDLSHSKLEERQYLALQDTRDQSQSPSVRNKPELQEYQVQLMILEKANKKIAMMARQQEYTPEMSSFESGGTASKPSTSDSHQISRKRRLSDSGRELKLDDQELDLNLAGVQNYIAQLEKRVKRLNRTSSSNPQSTERYRTLYRILSYNRVYSSQGNRQDSWQPFLSAPFNDAPEWIGPVHTGPEWIDPVPTGKLHCKDPIQNFDLFLEQNKDLAFIVFKTYTAQLPEPDRFASEENDIPNITVTESIKPITRELIEAVNHLLGSQDEYADLWHNFKKSSELPAPYLFVFHQRRCPDTLGNTATQASQEPLTLLWEYVIENHGNKYKTVDASLSNGKIASDSIQYLFKPGDILVQRETDFRLGWVAKSWAKHIETYRTTRAQAREIIDNTSRLPPYGMVQAPKRLVNEGVWVQSWTIPAWNWDFDGNFQRKHREIRFWVVTEDDPGPSPGTTYASKAQGKEPMTTPEHIPFSDLEVFPIKYAPDEIRQQLWRRGQAFWRCRIRKLVTYEVQSTDSQDSMLEERYMVDLKAYRSLHKSNQYATGVTSELRDELGPEAMAKDEPPDDGFLFLLPPTIKGFNMRRKKWFDLIAERITDVQWNEDAFEKVVMNSKAKDLIQALVSHQLASEESTDLIANKGNGLILLLHGSPGTGKTLTAEGVAEITKKPLYRLTCADIGTKPEEAEKYLESILHLGKLWKCVVLLDEADVFLEQRSLEDLKRNSLVSVFLRVLEYYEGILILTSNRVGTFDEAFKSRVQLALHYPTLGPYKRGKIWENFLERLEKLKDTSVDTLDIRDHVEQLQNVDMNGRQIRNVITTARQYAKWKNVTLTYKHLKEVIDISGEFDVYLDGLHGGQTQDELAKEDGVR